MSVKQLSVFIENKAGQLASITGILAEASVDLRAISIAETSQYGVLRLIVDDCEKAKTVLKSKGLVVNVTDVVAVEVPDVPGGLNRVLGLFAQLNVDIEYMYSLFSTIKGTAVMIFKSKEQGSIEKALEGTEIKLSSGEELGIY